MAIKPSGPQGVARPFVPRLDTDDPAERIAHALESLAVTFAAIDHNLEALVERTPKLP